MSGIYVPQTVPVAAATVPVPNGFDYLYLQPAGTLATLTVNPPAGANHGDKFNIMSTQIVTALTITPLSGQSLLGTITSLAANVVGGRWIFYGPTQTWVPA